MFSLIFSSKRRVYIELVRWKKNYIGCLRTCFYVKKILNFSRINQQDNKMLVANQGFWILHFQVVYLKNKKHLQNVKIIPLRVSYMSQIPPSVSYLIFKLRFFKLCTLRSKMKTNLERVFWSLDHRLTCLTSIYNFTTFIFI